MTAAICAIVSVEADAKFALPWLLRHVLSNGGASNRSNRRLGAMFSNALPVASFPSMVLPVASVSAAMPARPLLRTRLLRIVFPELPAKLPSRMPQ
ncbi:MAG: hypothetical protein ABIP65_01975 [Vicinamibacterales bacterium]